MMNALIEKLKTKEQRMIDIRRYLHQHPELSFHEEATPKYIADFTRIKIVKLKRMWVQMALK